MIKQEGRMELEGELFVLVEEDKDETHICAEVMGIDIWKWLEQNHGRKIKITLERK